MIQKRQGIWKRSVCILLAAAALMSLVSCGAAGGKGPKDVTKIKTESGYTRLEFSEANGVAYDGIGAEFDPHLMRSINTIYGVTEADWDRVVERVTAMKLQRARVMVMPEWFEPKNENDDPFDTDMDAFSWDNKDMNALYRVLNLAEANGISIILTLWGAHASHNSWLAVPGCVHWVSPPNDLDEWSENFCALLKYLMEVKGYTCVKSIIPYNEPYPAYYVKDLSEATIEAYSEMVVNLEARMRTEGVRDYVDLLVGDDGGIPQWLMENVQDPGITQASDGFSIHNYFTVYQTLQEIRDTAEMYIKSVRNSEANADKPIYAAEFGAKYPFDDATWDERLTYFDRGMTVGKIVTVYLGLGVSGMSHWCLFDEYYGEGSPMYRGLWGFINRDWEIYPAYYALAAVTQHTQVGSSVYQGQTRDMELAGTALRSESGWTYLLVNESALPKKVAIVNGNIGSETLNCYLYTEDGVPTDGSLALPSSGTVDMTGNVLYYEIPANTFAVLSEN